MFIIYLHVVKECERFGDLQSLSSYPFENKLYKIGNLLRCGRYPLQQIANRLTEILFANEKCSQPKQISYPIIRNERKGGVMLSLVTVRDGLFLSTKDSNKWFLTKNKEIVSFKSVDQNGVYGEQLKTFSNAFASCLIYVFKSNNIENISRSPINEFSQILCKFVTTQVNGDTFFVPLHHTLPLSYN